MQPPKLAKFYDAAAEAAPVPVPRSYCYISCQLGSPAATHAASAAVLTDCLHLQQLHLAAACDEVHVTLARGSQAAATLDVGRLLHDANLLQGLEDVAHQTTSSLLELLGGHTLACAATKQGLEAANANIGAVVQATAHSSSAHKVPVLVVGGQLLELAGLHNINPGGQVKLVVRLQVSRISGDEVLCRNILHACWLEGRHAGAVL
mmetsp:Transcript_8346/g.8250  ORF Transcript_8346/g.8250 Transcript_8346/m.8250 type:complete len:206 (+) Transcript_8346:217-834(+)